MFNTDKPITTKKDDLLGRSSFAKAIAQIALEHLDAESHVIGLYGTWGAGKTSTINLIREQLNLLSKNQEDSPIFLSFSSWGSNFVTDVFSMFMDSLERETAKHGKIKQSVKQLVEVLLEYGSCVSSIYPPVGNVVEKAKTLFKKKKERSLVELKERVSSILKKERNRLIVVIDDLDRLSDEQIRHVFQFVNVIADFPNVIYLLPFDYEVVSYALSGVQGNDGAAYLSKIIQVPLYLPEPPTNSLLTLLDSEVGSLLDVDREDYDRQRMYRIVEDFIAPFMKTPRDVRRLQNVYLFQMNLFSEGLNSLDLLALSSLMTFEPTVFEWIKKNKDLVLGGSYFSDQKAHQEHLTTSLKDAGIPGPFIDETIRRLGTLFPSIQGRGFYGSGSALYWRERRVCHKEIFDGYFMGRPKEDWLSTREVADAVNLKDFDSLRDLAGKSIGEGNFLIFLEEINCRFEIFDDPECTELGELLFDCWGKCKEESREVFFSITPDRKIEYLLERVFEKIDIAEADAMILRNIDTLDVAGLAAAAPFLNGEELAHGRLASESQNERKQRLSLEGVKKTEGAFVQRLSELKENEEFLDHDDLYMLMYLWSCFDEEGYVEFWHSKIRERPINVCYLLASHAGRWTSGETYGWSFSKEIIEKIASKEKIDEVLRSLIVEDTDDEISDLVFEKTACFYYNGYKGVESFDRLSVQECRELFLKMIEER